MGGAAQAVCADGVASSLGCRWPLLVPSATLDGNTQHALVEEDGEAESETLQSLGATTRLQSEEKEKAIGSPPALPRPATVAGALRLSPRPGPARAPGGWARGRRPFRRVATLGLFR